VITFGGWLTAKKGKEAHFCLLWQKKLQMVQQNAATEHSFHREKISK